MSAGGGQRTSIAHGRQGSGPPVALVHGLGATRALWKHVAPDLAREFTVLSFDLRGTGDSARPAGPYSLDDFVSDLRGLIEGLDLERPALVGHSFGGSIVLRYAADYPDDVPAVASIGGPVELPEQGRQGMRDRAETVEAQGMAAVAETVATNGLAASFREAHPDEFRAYTDLLAANDPQTYAATCRVIADLDLTDDLRRIDAPVLLIAGDLDGVVPPAAQEAIASAIRRVESIQVPDCAHIVPWEKPELLRDEVLRFLRAHAPVATT
jgi:3-oxoadipate enol-lactonase